MAPGGAAIRSATSRWSISTSGARPRLVPSAVEHRAGDVVGQVRDGSQSPSTRASRCLVEEVALHQPQLLEALEAGPRWAYSRSSSSTAVTGRRFAEVPR